MTTDERIERLASKLDTLRAQDSPVVRTVRGWPKVFGASSHRYRLNPPVDPVKLAEVERQLGCLLPEGYRQWLLKVGDGGAGPCHGLLSLAEAVDPLEADPALDLSADFPFTPDRPCHHLGEVAMEGDDIAILRGVAFLAEEGCGMYDMLVLRGPAAGQVWWMTAGDGWPALPLFHPDTGEPFDFLRDEDKRAIAG